jgi:16S rRNA C967 or C1407 C5-methylase (RsmB/RsmF family)
MHCNSARTSEEAALNFYAEHDVAVQDFLSAAASVPYRFVRLNPRFDANETLQRLKEEAASDPLAVPWLDGFYALPATFSLNQSTCFQSSRVYGQDVSSGAAVAALMTDKYDRNDEKNKSAAQYDSNSALRILDLCCCPGLKLCAMADFLHSSSGAEQNVIVGVDVSERRMAVCKRVVHKYQIASESKIPGVDQTTTTATRKNVRIRLYCNDGTKFGMIDNDEPLHLVFDSVAATEEETARQLGERKRMNKSARMRERKRLKEMETLDLCQNNDDDRAKSSNMVELFDRILVDAECSTDGSLIHVQKRLEKSMQSKEKSSTDATLLSLEKLTNEQQLTDLIGLQRQLAATGFRLLRQGGVLVSDSHLNVS